MLHLFKKQNYISFFQDVDAIHAMPTDNGDEWYGYIPKQYPFEDIIEHLPANAKVVDLGCGFCENLLYLGSLLENPELHGVEFNSDYYNDVSPLVTEHNLPITLHNENILNHDISSYDIIYTFCPAKTDTNYQAYTDYILQNMKDDAVWIEAHKYCPGEENSETVDNAISRYSGEVTKLYEDSEDNGLLVIIKK